MRGASQVVCIAIGAFGLLAEFVVAGDLTPPAGPVAGTFKTLNEVEPRIPINNQTAPSTIQAMHWISTPGSYYLTGDIIGQAGKIGIHVAASNVTIDFNGYTLDGAKAGTTGVYVLGSQNNVTLRNGFVVNWTGDGIDIINGHSSRIERMASSFNDGFGMRGGINGLIVDCMAESNQSYGFNVQAFSAISGSNASENADNGFQVSAGVRVTDCVARLNDGSGFFAGTACALLNCVAYENTVDGIFLSAGSQAEGCTVSSNGASGITLGTGAIAVNCAALANSTSGFVTSSGSSVIDCNAYQNGQHGVVCGGNAFVRGGVMTFNGTAIADGCGVLVNGSDSRVEGVHAIDNDYGVRAINTGSLVVACSASGNSVADIDAAVGINGPTLTVDPTDEAWGNFDY